MTGRQTLCQVHDGRASRRRGARNRHAAMLRLDYDVWLAAGAAPSMTPA
jgi:hypothetical protein